MPNRIAESRILYLPSMDENDSKGHFQGHIRRSRYERDAFFLRKQEGYRSANGQLQTKDAIGSGLRHDYIGNRSDRKTEERPKKEKVTIIIQVGGDLKGVPDKYSIGLTSYFLAKRSKSAIWRSISSRAESEAERIPWMRSLNSSALEARARASSRVMSCLE